MSGGSLEYISYKIETAADEIETGFSRSTSDRRTLFGEFAKFLREVAKATHDIEYDLSGDQYIERGSEEEARIKRLIGATIEPAKLDELLAARNALDNAIETLERVALGKEVGR